MQTILKSYLWILLVFPSFFVDAQAVLEIECNVLKAQMLKGENPNLKNEFSTFFLEKELIPNVWGKYKFKKGLTSSVTFENIPYGTYRVTIVKNQNQKKSKTVINRNDVKNINRKKNLEKVDVYISNIIQFDKANTAFPCNDKPTLQQNFSSEKELGNFTFYPNPTKEEVFFKWDRKLGEELVVKILDLTGKEIKFEKFASSQSVINLKSIAPGIYLVKSQIIGTDFTDINKLIIQ